MTLAAAERTALERAYGWTITEVETLHEGENTTYAVTTHQDKYALRRYRSERYTLAEVEAELEWLAALADSVPVVPALQTRDGARCVVRKQDGVTEIYAAFPYLTGNEPDPPIPSDFEHLGRLLRQLHNAAAHILEAKLESWARYQRPVYNAEIVNGALESLLQTPLLDGSDKRRCTSLAEQLRELYTVCSPKMSFVHADLHFSNVLVNGGTWTLLDFDECGFGFSAFDSGTIRFHALARGQTEGWPAFLRGYGEPLLTEVETKLGTAMRMFYTAGKLPLRLDIPDVRADAAGLIQKYLALTEQELAGTQQVTDHRQRRAAFR